MSPALDERTLITRILAHDPLAERWFYDAHATDVYRLALQMTQDEGLAQDCTQETFIRAFDRLGQFRGDASLRTWLRRVTISVVLNQLKRHRVRWTYEVPWQDLSWEDMPIEAGPGEGDRWNLSARLGPALDALPAFYREVVVLHDVEGHTHGAIAQLLGITIATSKVRLFRARARLRRALTGSVDGMIGNV